MNATMPEQDPKKLVFMRISKEVTGIVTEIEPAFMPFTATDGTVVVELDKASHGFIVIPKGIDTHYIMFNNTRTANSLMLKLLNRC
jgi:hypothetical protein